MTRRFITLLILQLLGGAAGWWLFEIGRSVGAGGGGWMPSGIAGALCGAALATWAWVAADTRAARHVLGWLRNDEAAAAAAPSLSGLWGEVSDRARRRLREGEIRCADSEGRLDEILSALQASPNGVVLLDASGRIEWCNQTAADHFGIDVERDMLQSIGNLVRDPLFASYWARRDFTSDVVMPGRRSTPARPVRLSVHLHAYGDRRTLLLSRDVTALEQADAMRRDFVANVSHEMRTPLTVLTGFVETLQTLPLDAAERNHYLGLMAQQASRMQTVVSDLLTLSRLEGSPLPGTQDSVSVAALLTQCEQEGQALTDVLGRGHSLRFPDAAHIASAGSIAGAPHELQSAMSNLVGNAIRYTAPGGTITVGWTVLDGQDRARGNAGDGEFAVHDTGCGIAPEHIPRLTERFYRVDRSRSRETGGTGLGLAIVKHVMQRHGARLRIDSRPGLGSTFALVFPAQRLRAAPAPAARPAGSMGITPATPAPDRANVEPTAL